MVGEGIVAQAVERRAELGDGVVAVWARGVAGRTVGSQVEAASALLGHAAGEERAVAHAHLAPAALGQAVLGVEPLGHDDPAHALVGAVLFVGGGEQHDVALEGRAGAGEVGEYGQVPRAPLLHVYGAAAHT